MFLDDVITVLTAAGLGAYGVNIFKGRKALIPAGDGPFISVSATGGRGEEGTHNDSRDGIAYGRPSAQIICRAKDYVVAEQAAQNAYLALNFVEQFINGGWWRSCSPKQEPFELPQDEQGRARMAFNIDCVKRVAPATSTIVVPSAPPGEKFVPLIDMLGGNRFAFSRPSVVDAYAAGSAYAALVPESWILNLDSSVLGSTYVLEASACVEIAGARAKVGFFNLDIDVKLAEITFTTSEVDGERLRTTLFSLSPGVHSYGVKITTNNLTIGGAAWGCRLLRLS